MLPRELRTGTSGLGASADSAQVVTAVVIRKPPIVPQVTAAAPTVKAVAVVPKRKVPTATATGPRGTLAHELGVH